MKITKEMIQEGYNRGIVQLIDSPHSDGTVCQIGEHWFYFGGLAAEERTSEEYRKEVPEATIIEKIYEALNDLVSDGFEDEYSYYVCILQEHKKLVHKIVITGGPCAGKTTAMSWIQNVFTEKGYRVLFVPETATELITGGVAPWTCSSNKKFQGFQIQLQKKKEEIFEKAAVDIPEDKILIVCDRGLLDNKAYMSARDFYEIVKRENLNEIEMRDGYDAVFHLVTAAKGAAEFYTLANNAARTETLEEAIALDDKLIAAWTGHPHFRIIDNSTDFEKKMERLIKEIAVFLGEPEPYEIERKYLIEYPDVEKLEKMINCQKVEISQTYLSDSAGNEVRVRQRGKDGDYIYTQTTKKNVSGCKRVEIEKRLSEREYVTLLMQADPECRPIRKTRYCLMYKNQYFEIDLYPFWKDRAIVEIELSKEDDEIQFPDFLKVIQEVTEDESYKNHSLAKQLS